MHPTHRTTKALLRQINEEVASLPEAPLRALIGPMVAAERELTADLEALVGRMGEKYSAQVLRNSLLQVRSSLNAVKRLRPEMTGELAKAGQRGRLLATGHLQTEVAKFAMHFDGSLRPVPVIPASRISQHLLLERFSAASARYTDGVQADIRRQLTIGMLRGESVGQMAARLTGQGPRVAARVNAMAAPEQARVVSEAMWKKYRYQARRLVRTEVIHVYNEHASDQIQQLAKDEPGERWGEKWVAELDSRVCTQCRRLDGVTIEAGGIFPGAFRGAPPLHAQCRCTIVAWNPRWDKRAASAHGVKLGGPA